MSERLNFIQGVTIRRNLVSVTDRSLRTITTTLEEKNNNLFLVFFLNYAYCCNIITKNLI